MGRRIDYDKIAKRYDSNPLRRKQIDADLLFYWQNLKEEERNDFAALDMGCGTGSQLATNRAELKDMRLVGIDLSPSMLEIAKTKADEVEWVLGDVSKMPFKNGEFNYISSQFQFHHVVDQQKALSEAYRVLKPKGRLVMYLLYPLAMKKWIMYKYFPKAQDFDLRDHPEIPQMKEMIRTAGFERIHMGIDYESYECDFESLLESLSQQDYNSQTQMLSAAEYQKGIQRLKQDAEISRKTGRKAPSEIAILRIVCDKGQSLLASVAKDRS
jgi:SAM-dependent methyltransferase